MNAGRETGPPPLSRTFTVAELEERAGDPVVIEATQEERDGLARLFGIPAISKVHAKLVARVDGRSVHVTGEVKAAVTRTCVVTLEPFESEVDEPVDVRFAEQAGASSGAVPAVERDGGKGKKRSRGRDAEEEEPVDEEDLAESEDPPDPIVGGRIDLGALAAEHVALGLDPYPRKPGARFEAPEAGDDDAAADSPFAVLGKLKKPDKP